LGIAIMEILALIPARGGSKSIPRKNIRPLAGYPLIAYSIAAAKQSRRISRTIVSTDDEEIARIAQSFGAEVPFLRPLEYALDSSPDYPVFVHALRWLEENDGYRPDIVVQLRPTSPLRPPDCVDRAIETLLDHPDADSVRGVIPSGQNPYKMWQVDAQGRMTPLLRLDGLAEPFNTPRQELPQTYWQTGHIDAIRTSTVLQKHSLSGEVILPLFLDPRYAVDIDSLRDWQRAEWTISQADLPIVLPNHHRRPFPKQVDLVVFDFDGVMTDDRVWVDQAGHESVAVSRSDGMGISLMRKADVPMVVLSTESNPVVSARCRKLDLPVVQGLSDKPMALRQLIQERQVDPSHVVYLANDINDLPCFPLIGCAVVVADAHPRVLSQADVILTRTGGHGAVRELCDRILDQLAPY
jgi:YrbI family 3-deoxy-D-manno-octulosonate 8-phosphate phosphatase